MPYSKKYLTLLIATSLSSHSLLSAAPSCPYEAKIESVTKQCLVCATGEETKSMPEVSSSVWKLNSAASLGVTKLLLKESMMSYINASIDAEVKELQDTASKLVENTKSGKEFKNYFLGKQFEAYLAGMSYDLISNDPSYQSAIRESLERQLMPSLLDLKSKLKTANETLVKKQNKDSDRTTKIVSGHYANMQSQAEKALADKIERVVPEEQARLEETKYRLLGQNTLMYQDKKPSALSDAFSDVVFHSLKPSEKEKVFNKITQDAIDITKGEYQPDTLVHNIANFTEPDVDVKQVETEKQLLKRAGSDLLKNQNKDSDRTAQIANGHMANAYNRLDDKAKKSVSSAKSIEDKLVQASLSSIKERIMDLEKTKKLLKEKGPTTLGMWNFQDLVETMINQATTQEDKNIRARAACELYAEMPKSSIPHAQIVGMVMMVGGVAISFIPSPGATQAAGVVTFTAGTGVALSSLYNTYNKVKLRSANPGLFELGLLSPKQFEESIKENKSDYKWAAFDVATLWLSTGVVGMKLMSKHMTMMKELELAEISEEALKAKKIALDGAIFKVGESLESVMKTSNKVKSSLVKLGAESQTLERISPAARGVYIPVGQEKYLVKSTLKKFFTDQEGRALIEGIGEAEFQQHAAMGLRSKIPMLLKRKALTPQDKVELELAFASMEKEYPESAVKMLQAMRRSPNMTKGILADEEVSSGLLKSMGTANQEKAIKIFTTELANAERHYEVFAEQGKIIKTLGETLKNH